MAVPVTLTPNHSDWVFVATPPGEAKAKAVFQDLKFRSEQVNSNATSYPLGNPLHLVRLMAFAHAQRNRNCNGNFNRMLVSSRMGLNAKGCAGPSTLRCDQYCTLAARPQLSGGVPDRP